MPYNLPPSVWSTLGSQLLGGAGMIDSYQERKRKEAQDAEDRRLRLLQLGFSPGEAPEQTVTVEPRAEIPKFEPPTNIFKGAGVGMQPEGGPKPSPLVRPASGTPAPPEIFRGKPVDLGMPEMPTSATGKGGYDEATFGGETYHRMNPEAQAQQESNRALEADLTRGDASRAGNLQSEITMAEERARIEREGQDRSTQQVADALKKYKTGTPDEQAQAEAFLLSQAGVGYQQLHPQGRWSAIGPDADGKMYEINDLTGETRPTDASKYVPGTGGSGGAQAQQQSGLAELAATANKGLEGLDTELTGALVHVPEVMKPSLPGLLIGGAARTLTSDKGQQATIQSENFINSVVPYFSGKQMTQQERMQYRAALVPQTGERGPAIQAKRMRRAYLVQVMQSGQRMGKTGPDGSPDISNLQAIISEAEAKFPTAGPGATPDLNAQYRPAPF